MTMMVLPKDRSRIARTGGNLPRRRKGRSVVLIRGDVGRKCEMMLTSAGDSLVLENVILALSASFLLEPVRC